MMELKMVMRVAQALTIGVDGVTNVLSRSMSNVIVHDPRPWFGEFLKSDQKKESAVEVTRKIVSVVSRLNRTNINYMFVRLAKVKRAITAVVAAVLNEKDERQIDVSYELPASFVPTVMDGGFWRSVADSVTLFDPICKCIGILEINTATLSTVYACFVYVYLHMGRVMTEADAKALRGKLLYRWKRISSPVHALAFYCDPFYRSFRVAITESNSDPTAPDLGSRDVFQQCRDGIALLCRLDDDNAVRLNHAIKEFYKFSASNGESAEHWGDPAWFRPHMIWSQGQRHFPVLSQLLIKVYSVPSSSAGVERNHKVAKRIHTAPRNHTSRGKVEQQVAVSHNGAVAEMALKYERHPYEVFIRNNPLQNAMGSAASQPPEIAPSSSPNGQSGEADTVVLSNTTIDHQTEDDEGDDEYFDDVLADMTDGELLEQETLSAALALCDLTEMPEHIMCPLHEE